MKRQRNRHEPRQYFSNSLCLFCRGWSGFGEYFCHSGKQVYWDGVTYLLVYSRIVFHPSISCLGLNEGDECTGIFLINLKAFKVQVLQGVVETRSQLGRLRQRWFHTRSRRAPCCWRCPAGCSRAGRLGGTGSMTGPMRCPNLHREPLCTLPGSASRCAPRRSCAVGWSPWLITTASAPARPWHPRSTFCLCIS